MVFDITRKPLFFLALLSFLAPLSSVQISYAQDGMDGGLHSPDFEGGGDAGMPAMVEEMMEKTDVPVPGESALKSPSVDIPSLVEEGEEPEEDLFFDAESLVPTGEIGRKGGPQKVNPRLQPASRFVVVRKNHAGDSREAQIVSADRALKLGLYESALEIYDSLYERNKRDPNILMGRAVALQRLGRTEMALRAYEELLSIYPENVSARVNMLGVMSQKYPAVALQQLLALREKNPDHVGIVAQIAVAQAQLSRYSEAIRYLGVAASMEPQNASHVFNMAVVADRAGEKKEAVKFYEQALELDTLYGTGQSTIPRDTIFERLAHLR